MRKFFLFLFLMFTCNLFCYTEEVKENLMRINFFINSFNCDEAMDELSDLIEDSRIPNIEKIHYIWARANLYNSIYKDRKNYKKDIHLLTVIIKYDPECAKAMEEYYQYP